MKVYAKIGAVIVAIMVVASLIFLGSSSAAPVKIQDQGVTTCHTDSNGYCTVQHNLGTTPTSVQLTPQFGTGTKPFTISNVDGATATTIKVRAMYLGGTVAKNINIRFNYLVMSDGSVPPTSTTTSTTSQTTSTTEPEPPTSSTTTTTEPPSGDVPALGSYVKPGEVGFKGNLADLTVVDATHMPDNCHWDADEGITCVGDTTFDHAYLKAGLYWDIGGTLTIKNSVVEGGTPNGNGKWTIRAFRDAGAPPCTINIQDSTLRWSINKRVKMQAASVLTDCAQKIYRNDISQGDSALITYHDNDAVVQNYIHDLHIDPTVEPHLDGVFVGGGNNTLIQQNYIDTGFDKYWSQTAVVFFQCACRDTKIYANYLSGGGYTWKNETSNNAVTANNTFDDTSYDGSSANRQPIFCLTEELTEGSTSWTNNFGTSGKELAPPIPHVRGGEAKCVPYKE